MKIETTVQQIRALLQLAEVDERMPARPADAHSRQRETIRRRVAPVLLDHYQNLLEHGRWPAIVAIDRGGCSGCHVRLPTMVEHQARRPGIVHTCPHCRRLLYAPEFLVAEARAAVALTKPGKPASAGKGPDGLAGR